MGTVYLVTHLMLSKSVALKVIKPELVTSKGIVDRFRREARAAGTLNHPGIAAVYDFGQAKDGTLYIEMEFVDGPSWRPSPLLRRRFPSGQ
jgi:serine/threonine-protein kinase